MSTVTRLVKGRRNGRGNCLEAKMQGDRGCGLVG